MDDEQVYVPRPRAGQGGWLVVVVVVLAVLLLLCLLAMGALFVVRSSYDVQVQRAVEAEHRARMEAERARDAAEQALQEAERLKQGQPE